MTGGAIQRVLAALERAGSTWRHQSGGYMARCPAHDDHKPSLSITPGAGKDGDPTVLLCCQTGCSTDSVLTAMNLTWPDLYDKPEHETSRRTIAVTYDYRDAAGTLLYQKVRYTPRGFSNRRPAGNGEWLWNLDKDTPRVLYNLPEVLAAVREGRTIYICEGEKDVDRLTELGHAATCNFDGASQGNQRPKWRDTYSDNLIGAHVIIIADNDEPGFTHARAIATSLAGKATSVKLVRGLVDDLHADVSDHLDAGHDLTELTPLDASPAPAQVATNGHRTGPVAITDTAVNKDDKSEPPAVRRLRPVLASEVTLKRIRWLWQSRIILGGLTLLAGREGLGKSTIAVDICSQVTRGILDGEMYGTPRTVIYVNSEDARDYTIVPRLIAAEADLDRVVFLDALTGDDIETNIVLPLDTDLLANAVIEHDAAMVILDAATSVIDSRLDGDKDRQIRQALEAIARKVGENTGTAVLGIVHFGKRDSSDTGKLILGSIAWSQVARSTLAVAQDTDTGNLVLTGSKANLAPADTPSLAVQIVSAAVDTDEGPTSVGRVQWLGETDQDARDLLDPDAGTDRTERNEARDWLRDYLGGGRVKSSEAKRAATAAGISERTLQRARSQLKVRITAEGFPRTSYWSLPAWPASGATPGATSEPRARGGACGTTGSTDDDLHKHSGTTAGTTGGTTESGTTGPASSGATGTTVGPAQTPVLPVVPRAPARAYVAPARETDPSDINTSGDQWVHAHLTAKPQTLARLVTDLDATPGAVSDALARLTQAGHAQHHSHDDTWSLPTKDNP